MTLQAIVVCPVVLLLALLLARRGLDLREQRMVGLGYLFHIVGSVAIVLYHSVYDGDMNMYAMLGKQIAYVISVDPVRWGGETLKLALQLDNDLPVEVLLPGTSTGSMSAFTGLVMSAVGDSMYATAFVFSTFAFMGLVGFYRASRSFLAASERIPALIGLLFVPSVVFWTGGMVKEAVVVGFAGMMCEALHRVFSRRQPLAIIPLVVGIEGTLITKPYVLLSLVVAFGAWFYATNNARLGWPGRIFAALAVAVGIAFVTHRYPELSPENITESFSKAQRNYGLIASGGGGSEITVGEDDGAPPTVLGHLKWAPLGLTNSLARPFLFEVHNVNMAVAALEMTAIIFTFGVLLRRHGVRRLLAEVRTHPPLLFAVTLVLLLGASVGLATRNLGTLSRYRVPMMPMYVAGLLVLRARFAALGRRIPMRLKRGTSTALGRARARSQRTPESRSIATK